MPSDAYPATLTSAWVLMRCLVVSIFLHDTACHRGVHPEKSFCSKALSFVKFKCWRTAFAEALRHIMMRGVSPFMCVAVCSGVQRWEAVCSMATGFVITGTHHFIFFELVVVVVHRLIQGIPGIEILVLVAHDQRRYGLPGVDD